MKAELEEILKSHNIVDRIFKGENSNEEEYGVDLLRNIKDGKDEIEVIHLFSITYDYCMSECTRKTAKAYPNIKIILHDAGIYKIFNDCKLDFSDYNNIEILY